MAKGYRYGLKPPRGTPPKLGEQKTELISQQELAGETPLPEVRLIPNGPALEIIELYPSPPPPPPPPLTRDFTTERLQVGLAALSDEEMKVAHLWLIGEDRVEMCDILGISEAKVKSLWQHMRWKLRLALEGKEPVGSPPGYEQKG